MPGTGRAFACRCGALTGEIADLSPAVYTRVVCHCADCRAAHVHLGGPDPGPVDTIHTSQSNVRLRVGTKHIAAFRLTARGPIRWHASCCATPLMATAPAPRLVHVAIETSRLTHCEGLGRVRTEAFVPTRDGATGHRGALRMVAGIASRIAAGNMRGAWRASPFFDGIGDPIVAPVIVTTAARSSAKSKVTAKAT